MSARNGQTQQNQDNAGTDIWHKFGTAGGTGWHLDGGNDEESGHSVEAEQHRAKDTRSKNNNKGGHYGDRRKDNDTYNKTSHVLDCGKVNKNEFCQWWLDNNSAPQVDVPRLGLQTDAEAAMGATGGVGYAADHPYVPSWGHLAGLTAFQIENKLSVELQKYHKRQNLAFKNQLDRDRPGLY